MDDLKGGGVCWVGVGIEGGLALVGEAGGFACLVDEVEVWGGVRVGVGKGEKEEEEEWDGCHGEKDDEGGSYDREMVFYGFFVDHGRFRLIVGIQNLLFNVCCKRRGGF